MNRHVGERETAALRGIGRIERLVAEIVLLKANLDAVPLWGPAAGLGAECDETVRMIRAIATRLERSAVVTLIGPSGSGKSTLVNALAGGRELSPSGHRRPTTGRLVLLGGGPDASELVGELERGAVEILSADATGLPERLCLVDTPDTDSMEYRRHVPALERAVEHSDVLVCVFDGENPKRRDHADFLAPFVRRFDGESLVAVINKCDRLDEAELKDRILPDFRDYLRRGWQRPLDHVVCTSARRHVQAPGWDATAGPRHGFDQFEELRELVYGMGDGSGRVSDRRVENARRLHQVMLEDAARELAADRDAARSGLEAFEQVRAQAFAAAAGALRDTDPRRGGGWGVAFHRSLAARWVGPVGWMLAAWTRVVAIGSGVGTLLRWARPPWAAEPGKPPGGGGVGVPGMESALRGYRMALLSGWPTVSEWLARARFAPLVRDIEAPLDAAEPAAERLAEIWDDAVRRETEAAARRLAGTWLQGLLNAPVVGVMAYVGWVTVRTFFSGDYLPGDFFMHAFWVIAITLLLSFCALQMIVRLAGSERVIGRAFEAVQEAIPGVDGAVPHPLKTQLQRLVALSEAAPPG